MKSYKKFWTDAKKNILGGNMLLSKRPEMFIKDYWPTYFTKSQGINVWDIYGKKYIDFIFAVGQSTLGYANLHVDRDVKKFISKGNMTTLNCYEEVKLAKKLLKIHKWANKVKFARSGGEANAIAIRIARAACKNKKTNIAICGYHGWHDWYLSVNLQSNKNLDQHLLPGLQPKGVPRELKNTTHAFEYGDFERLEQINKKYPLGIIKMEVARDNFPNIDFLKKVRKFCNKKNIILIFDECTSGFRYNLGGLHLKTKIEPDLAMFGKAIGNGYAISAVIGKNKVMDKAKDSFISSTFWTERVGFVAALKTIDTIEKKKTYNILKKQGKYIKKKWQELSKKYNFDLKINEMDCICNFKFKKDHNIIKTFITKEMLKKGYLASNMIYLSIEHNKKAIDKYITALNDVFKKLSNIKKDKKLYQAFISSKEIAKSTFARLIS